MFRVANKDMTYAQQLRDYEKKVMEVSNASFSSENYFLQVDLTNACLVHLFLLYFDFLDVNFSFEFAYLFEIDNGILEMFENKMNPCQISEVVMLL